MILEDYSPIPSQRGNSVSPGKKLKDEVVEKKYVKLRVKVNIRPNELDRSNLQDIIFTKCRTYDNTVLCGIGLLTKLVSIEEIPNEVEEKRIDEGTANTICITCATFELNPPPFVGSVIKGTIVKVFDEVLVIKYNGFDVSVIKPLLPKEKISSHLREKMKSSINDQIFARITKVSYKNTEIVIIGERI